MDMSASDREAWRQRPRSLVDRILREQLIAWQEVYQEASQICAEIQRVIDRTEQSRRRCEAVLQDERSSETEKTEAVRILDEVNRVNPLIDSGVMNKRNFFYIDEIWQIRTDMDNRSSIDAAINALLLWIGDIPSLTAEHRLIYRQDQDKVNAYKEWKSLMRKQFSTSKEKHGSYDAAAIAEEIRTTIKSIMFLKLSNISISDIQNLVSPKSLRLLAVLGRSLCSSAWTASDRVKCHSLSRKKSDQHILLNPTLSFAWKCFQIFHFLFGIAKVLFFVTPTKFTSKKRMI